MAAVNRYVVGVSGGIDSVVLLDVMRRLPAAEIIVAHFDHGIRDDSADDAAFVEGLAKLHGLRFETLREELGSDASEETARRRRYDFLRAVARRHKAKLVTAHHGDDLIETIAINHQRGTGWRGLTPMSGDIVRPLLAMDKQTIREYALRHGLEWREDSTNASDAYLRNRLRSRLGRLPEEHKKELLERYRRQRRLRKRIEQEAARLAGEQAEYSRYFFIHIPDVTAVELLRHITKGRLTRPQLIRALWVVKTAKPHTKYHAGNHVVFYFDSRQFTVELVK